MKATEWTKSKLLACAALATLLGTAARCADTGDDDAAATAALSPAARGLAPDAQFFIPAPNAGAERQFFDLIKIRALKDALRIAALETQIDELTTILADPNLYARDRARFDATAEALAVARDGLAAAEDQWLRLELLREGIEAAEPRY